MKQQELSANIEKTKGELLAGKAIKTIKEELKSKDLKLLTIDKIISKAKKKVAYTFAAQVKELIKNGGAQGELAAVYTDLAPDFRKKLIAKDVRQHKMTVKKQLKYEFINKNSQKSGTALVVMFSDQLVTKEDIKNWVIAFTDEENKTNKADTLKGIFIGPALFIFGLMGLISFFSLNLPLPIFIGAAAMGALVIGFGWTLFSIGGIFRRKREVPNFD